MANLIQINTKANVDGESGLPKYPVPQAEVRSDGVGDDHNNYRKNEKNNTPDRAVLFYTTDKIEELKNEGWPLEPGHLGENFTIEELSYDEVSIGDRLQIGEVEIEITEVCHPCSNLADLPYVGKNRLKEFIKTLKGRRGWYAKVITEGTVNEGDSVDIL